jgi:hypothetical protein
MTEPSDGAIAQAFRQQTQVPRGDMRAVTNFVDDVIKRAREDRG